MISFIIPTKNEEKAIEKTLQCLKGYVTPHEIIVSDGYSTDETVAIARRYTDKVAVYRGTARQTIAAGRNAGAALATGDFLVFLDADVTIPDINNFFKKAISLFEADRKLVALTTYYRVSPEVATWADKIIFKLIGWEFWLFNLLGFGGSGGELQMVPAAAFRRINGYNESLVAGEDNELFWRLAKIGRTRLERSLFIYHPGRRAHQIGWPRLLWQWFKNGLYISLFKKSASQEWTEIR